MMLRAVLLAARLATWPVPYADAEPPQAREERLQTIATALVLETSKPPPAWRWSPRDLLLATAVVTYHESGRWRLDVHDGRRRGDKGRSICLAQAMRG